VDPGLERLLRRLRTARIRLALVTGTSWNEVRRFVPRRVRALFRTVVTGDRVRRGKPHPEPYLTAFRRSGQPEAAVVVETPPRDPVGGAPERLVVALASSLPRPALREAHRRQLDGGAGLAAGGRC
jgi:beta-phosphoglucomutase